MMAASGETLVLQLPAISFDAPVAVNIWTRNIARAFALAGIPPTLVYFGRKRAAVRTEDGVTLTTVPLLQAWLTSLPKLSSLAYPIVQQRLLRNLGGRFSIVAPLGGPYALRDERRKVAAVRLGGATYLHPILEHPRVRFHDRGEAFLASYLDSVADLYDVLMPITTTLRDLFARHGRTRPTLLNPIVVDTRVEPAVDRPPAGTTPELLYCGNLEHREEMMLLFDAFAIVHGSLPSSRLTVVGGGCSRRASSALMADCRNACRSRGILDAVRFSGMLPHDEVLREYRHASVFLLPRPFRDYSQAGFPTKIGEYLATGKPVITTGTGDIPLYLRDGVSAYIAMDEDPRSFAGKVLEALADPASGDVGRAGAAVAGESFSIEAAADRIRRFWQR